MGDQFGGNPSNLHGPGAVRPLEMWEGKTRSPDNGSRTAMCHTRLRFHTKVWSCSPAAHSHGSCHANSSHVTSPCGKAASRQNSRRRTLHQKSVTFRYNRHRELRQAVDRDNSRGSTTIKGYAHYIAHPWQGCKDQHQPLSRPAAERYTARHSNS
jgi:hypothetical protein